MDLQGFKGARSSVTLSAAQTARVDFKMEVGSVEERLDVVATGAVLQTENAVVGVKVDREQIERLPAQGRNLSTATLYTAGVTSTNPNQFDSMRGGGRPAVNGQRIQGNNFTVDGVDSNEAINNGITYQPSPDAVEQVSVETNNYSAELGNVAGAVVNMVIKSGTNDFRGNAFYYARDNELAATPWATNRAGGKKSKFTRDVFGGTLGGPLLHNRLFFFGNYQGGRQETPPTDTFATVVPDAWRRGDLSSLLARNIVIRDPADPAAVPEQPDSGRALQPVRAEPVRRRDALSAGQRHAFADRLPRELPRHDRVAAGRRPVRPQVRLERVAPTTSCTCATRARPASRRPTVDGDAAFVRLGLRQSRTGAWRRTGTAFLDRRSSTTCWSAISDSSSISDPSICSGSAS